MTFLIVMLAFLAGALLAVGLSSTLRPQDPFLLRLGRIGEQADTDQTPMGDVARTPPLRPAVAALQKLGRRSPLSPALRMLLERAGSPGGLDGAAFSGLRIVSALTFLALAPLAGHVLGSTLLMKIVVALLALVIGLALPDAWLQGRASARQALIRKSLPDTLDLLVVSMEAGIGFDGAVAHAAAAMRGPLAEELERILQEMGLGRTRAEALRGMAGRAAVAELTSFAAAVTQADRLGSNLAFVLRAQADTARAQRMQRIRECAAKIPTKMLFPLVFFLLPALFVVLLGPGMINLLNALKH